MKRAAAAVTEAGWSDDDKWQAVVRRDRTADGQFYYSVATTGVYCRPSCGARQPRRDNVGFHDSPDAAEAAGYRPCKRCRPREVPGWAERTALVARACRFIEQSPASPTLEQVAAAVGLSPFHFHRVFRQVTGVTPKAYANAQRSRTVRVSLKDSSSITEAIYDAGYNANSRFYENARAMLGMSPKEYRAGGVGKVIHYAVKTCSLGLMLIGATEHGICTIQLGDSAATLKEALVAEFPGAELRKNGDGTLSAWIDAAFALVDQGKGADDLPLDIRGTAFQEKVWAALQAIPPGQTVSYKEVAEAIGAPKSARAVARACATNRIAVAIPCHRVVSSGGDISGYRWGVERKRELLAREQAK